MDTEIVMVRTLQPDIEIAIERIIEIVTQLTIEIIKYRQMYRGECRNSERPPRKWVGLGGRGGALSGVGVSACELPPIAAISRRGVKKRLCPV